MYHLETFCQEASVKAFASIYNVNWQARELRTCFYWVLR